MTNNIDLTKANEYLYDHFYNENWLKIGDSKKQSLLGYAETMVQSAFTFRKDAFKTDNYFHAVCEQAIHLINYEPERMKMQQQGVTYFMVDGLAFNLKDNLLSPVAKGFLKPIIKAKVGNVK